MSRSVTISACGFGRARGARRGRGGSVASSRRLGRGIQPSLPQDVLDVQAGTGHRGGQGAELEGTAERPRIRHACYLRPGGRRYEEQACTNCQ